MDRNGNATLRSALAGKVLGSLVPPQPVAFCRLWLQLLPFPADCRPLDQALLHSRNGRAGFGVAFRTGRDAPADRGGASFADVALRRNPPGSAPGGIAA